MINEQLKRLVSEALKNNDVAEWYKENHGINGCDDVTDSVIAKMICEDAGVYAE